MCRSRTSFGTVAAPSVCGEIMHGRVGIAELQRI